MEIIEQAYYGLFIVTILILALLILFCILRSALGPRTADRIIALNMIGTMIIMIIAVLSVLLDQNYLVDICLIYAMISFLGVVVLCKIYTGVYLQKKGRKATLKAIDENIRDQQLKSAQRLGSVKQLKQNQQIEHDRKNGPDGDKDQRKDKENTKEGEEK